MPFKASSEWRADATITEQGRYDLIFLATCQCEPKLVGLVFQCPDCGTVYGSEAGVLQELQPGKEGQF